MIGSGARRFEDLACAHALGALGASERRAFERILARSPGLRRETGELRRTASLLNLAGPAHEPPEGLADKVLLKVSESESDPASVARPRDAFTRLRSRVRARLAGKRKRVVVAALACAAVVLAARIPRATRSACLRAGLVTHSRATAVPRVSSRPLEEPSGRGRSQSLAKGLKAPIGLRWSAAKRTTPRGPRHTGRASGKPVVRRLPRLFAWPAGAARP